MQTATTPRSAPPDMRALADKLDQQRRRVSQVVYVFSPLTPLVCAPVPEGVIPAGRIYACEAIAQPHNVNDVLNVPDADRLHTYPAPEGKAAVVLLNLPANDYIQPVLAQYQAQGAVRLLSLDVLPVGKFEELRLSDYVTGANPPRTAREWLARLSEVEKADGSDKIRPLVAEMRRAVEVAHRWATDHLQRRHSQMELAKVGRSQEPAHYTPQDNRALEFTETTPRHEAQDRLAAGLLNSIAQPAAAPPPVNVQVVIDGDALKGVIKTAVDEALGGTPPPDAAPPETGGTPRKKKGD